MKMETVPVQMTHLVLHINYLNLILMMIINEKVKGLRFSTASCITNGAMAEIEVQGSSDG
jgi:hypothetical protein